jgi:hypothetical protein
MLLMIRLFTNEITQHRAPVSIIFNYEKGTVNFVDQIFYCFAVPVIRMGTLIKKSEY